MSSLKLIYMLAVILLAQLNWCRLSSKTWDWCCNTLNVVRVWLLGVSQRKLRLASKDDLTRNVDSLRDRENCSTYDRRASLLLSFSQCKTHPSFATLLHPDPQPPSIQAATATTARHSVPPMAVFRCLPSLDSACCRHLARKRLRYSHCNLSPL